MQPFLHFIHVRVQKLLQEANIDELLISRGFKYLEALIQRENELLGGDITLQRKELFWNEETSAQQIRNLNEIRKKCDNLDIGAMSVSKVDSIFREILTDKELFHHVKKMILHRYFRNQYAELVAPYEHGLEEARLREYRAICVRFGEADNESLGALDKLDKRRSVYNEVIMDVLLPHGFIKRATGKGFVTMHKLISDRFAVILSPDTVNLTRYFQTSGSLNIDNYIGAAKKSNKNRYYYFRYPMASFAFDVYRRYQDACSLEVAIRADGLFYEVLQPKLEVDIKEYLENHNVIVSE